MMCVHMHIHVRVCAHVCMCVYTCELGVVARIYIGRHEVNAGNLLPLFCHAIPCSIFCQSNLELVLPHLVILHLLLSIYMGRRDLNYSLLACSLNILTTESSPSWRTNALVSCDIMSEKIDAAVATPGKSGESVSCLPDNSRLQLPVLRMKPLGPLVLLLPSDDGSHSPHPPTTSSETSGEKRVCEFLKLKTDQNKTILLCC